MDHHRHCLCHEARDEDWRNRTHDPAELEHDQTALESRRERVLALRLLIRKARLESKRPSARR
jgi:predicted secreted protein